MRLVGSIKFTLAAVIVIALAVVVAGCGKSTSTPVTPSTGATETQMPATSAQEDPAVVAQLPAAIKNRGALFIATDASYPPNEFVAPDGKTLIGMDIDLARALGQVMGLDVVVKNATFDSILPGLAANKYNAGMSSFTDTKEREKTVDMVTYLNAGTSFYTSGTGGTDIKGLDDLCGLSVAVEKGTTQADDAAAQSKTCEKAGDKPVNVLVLPDQNGANLAVVSKKADIGMADSPVAAYIVKQSKGQLKLTGIAYGEAPYGIAMPKDNGLAAPMLSALKVLIAGGQYKAILAKWGLSDEAITDPKINDGV